MICVFLMGYLFGAYQKNKTNEYPSVPQHQLDITPELVDISQLTYEENNHHLQATIKLNDTGIAYNETNLFKKSYRVIVYLINSETNEEYLVSNQIKWTVKNALNLDVSVDSFLTKDESLLSDYQIEMRKLESNKEHHIGSRIEIYSTDDTTPIVTTAGMLKAR